MEFSFICRVCMQPISLEYIDLDTPFNEQTYFDCFNFCTRLNAFASDKLPKTICISCAEMMETAYNFVLTASKTDELLRQSLEDNESDSNFRPVYCNASYSVGLDEDATTEQMVSPSVDSTDHDDQQLEEEHIDDGSSIIEEEEEELEEKPMLEENTSPVEELASTKQSLEIVSISEPKKVLIIIPKAEENTLLPIEINKSEVLAQNHPNDCSSAVQILTVTKATDNCSNQSLKHTSNGTNSIDEISKEHLADYKPMVTEVKGDDNSTECNELHQCDKCNESFSFPDDLKLHILQNHKIFKDYWYCNLCGEALNSRTELTSHRNNDHQSKNPGLCITCGKSFADVNALMEHVTKEHWSRKSPEKCPYCQKKFQLDSLPMHVRYRHGDVVSSSKATEFVCQYCFKVCENLAKLNIHTEIHTATQDYECEICGIDLMNRILFEKHKNQMHPPSSEIPATNLDLRKCTKCDFTTNDGATFAKHKKRHYNRDHYKRNSKPVSNKKSKQSNLCAYCPKTFDSIKALNDHEDFRHGEKKNAHICDVCGKKYLARSLLSYHKRSAHGNDRPFLCDLCPKAFKLKTQLRQHMTFHQDKNIECPHCDKKFLLPCYLRIHMRSHTNELPYECHLCDRKFAIKVRLTYHLASHEGVLRKCEFCPETFENMAKLRIHRFEHTGYPFVCDICQEKYHRRVGFARHMNRAHGIVVTQADIDENRNRNIKKVYRNTESNDKTQVEA